MDASNGAWGLAMQNDLLDGVAWAVDQGVAAPGWPSWVSYGGYATLQAVTTAPEVWSAMPAGAELTAERGGERVEGLLDALSRARRERMGEPGSKTSCASSVTQRGENLPARAE